MRTQTAPAVAETTAQDTRSSNGLGRMTDKNKTAAGRWGERLRRAALATFAVLMGVLPLTPGTAFGATTFFHTDNLGSPVVATDEAGNVLWSEVHLPYGERILKQADVNDYPMQFTGEPEDPDTGMIYLRARYHAPLVGRFYAVDPLSFDSSLPYTFNRYQYGNNNPFRYTDPSGMESVGEMLDRKATEAASREDHAATYGWAFAEKAWTYFGAEGVSTVYDNAASGETNTGWDYAGAVLDFPALKAGKAAAKAGATVVGSSENLVYRAASGTPNSMTPRPVDVNGLSAANSLANALPGRNQVIDTSRLTNLCAVCDNPVTGHVSITPRDMSQMEGWMNSRGGEEVHALTQELMDAVVDTVKK